jgi:hypothetical protein
MDNNKQWYYLDKDRNITGPLNGDALLQLVAAGVISNETLVAVAGTQAWVPYLHVDSLDLPSDSWNPREDVPSAVVGGFTPQATAVPAADVGRTRIAGSHKRWKLSRQARC